VLTKSMLMEHFDDLVTDRSISLEAVRRHVEQSTTGELFLDRYRVTATSGSSGHPGFFLYTQPEWLTIMASFARGQEWSGARINLLRRRRMATVASTSPWHMSSQVSATAQSWWTPSIRLPASDPLESIVQRLNDWQPHPRSASPMPQWRASWPGNSGPADSTSHPSRFLYLQRY
jgi:phenylacetate-CoA ligase